MNIDSRLHYKNGVYRTTYLLKLLNCKVLGDNMLSDVFSYEKGENFSILPSGGAEGSRTLVQL